MARTTIRDKVRELQRTLCREAKADPKRRFHALYDKVYRRDVMEKAWDQVRQIKLNESVVAPRTNMPWRRKLNAAGEGRR